MPIRISQTTQTHSVCWPTVQTSVVVQHRVWHNGRVIKPRFWSPMFHVSTTHPPRAIVFLLFPVIPRCSSISIRPPIVGPIRSRHISVVWSDASAASSTSATATMSILMLLVPLGQIRLTVPILAPAIGSPLIIRLIVFLGISRVSYHFKNPSIDV